MWNQSPQHITPRLRLDYDPGLETRGLDVTAPVLTPPLLSGLTDHIVGPGQQGTLTLSASFEANGSMGGLTEIPLKSEAPGPSREADTIPPVATSKEEFPKHESSSQEMSHRDSPCSN